MNQIIQSTEQESTIDNIIHTINEIRTTEQTYEDKRDYLVDKINEFMQAVEQNQPKAHLFESEDEYDRKKTPYIHTTGKKAGKFKSAKSRQEFENKYHWSRKDDLSDWLIAVLGECDLRLVDVKNKLDNYSSEIATPFQQQVINPFIDEMKNFNADEVKRFDKVFYDYLEWNINKQKELIKSFLAGTFTFKEEDIIRRNMKTEITKIILESGDKVDDLKIEAEKIIKKPNLN